MAKVVIETEKQRFFCKLCHSLTTILQYPSMIEIQSNVKWQSHFDIAVHANIEIIPDIMPNNFSYHVMGNKTLETTKIMCI